MDFFALLWTFLLKMQFFTLFLHICPFIFPCAVSRAFRSILRSDQNFLVLRLRAKIRFVRLFEWETLFPTILFLPVT